MFIHNIPDFIKMEKKRRPENLKAESVKGEFYKDKNVSLYSGKYY